MLLKDLARLRRIAHAAVSLNGTYALYGGTVTHNGFPAYSDAFVEANSGGRFQALTTVFVPSQNAASGKHYNISSGASINAGGRGPYVLPGNQTGINNGGTYS